MVRCSEGHESTDAEFCSVCDRQIATATTDPDSSGLVRHGDLPVGSRIGPPAEPERYEIVRKLGQGGFGAAYLAEDRPQQRRCVVKETHQPPGATFSPVQVLAMVRREATLLANLNHSGLPAVWDAFDCEGLTYLAMSYVEGESLETIASRAPVDESEARRITREVASVLGYLHAQDPPIVHRDISPDNIIRSPSGAIVLLDFGAARFFEEGRSRDTVSIGKLGYAAPEATAQQTDARSDLYSLGAVIYRILTGHDPAVDPFRFPPIGTSTASLQFAAVLERLVAIRRADRFQSADEVIGAIEALPAGPRVCPKCGRTIESSAFTCPCGWSSLPRVQWQTLGGGAEHFGSAPVPALRFETTWTVDLGAELVGGVVGANGVGIVATRAGSIMGIDVVQGALVWAREFAPAYAGRSTLVADRGAAYGLVGRDLWHLDLRTGEPRHVVSIPIDELAFATLTGKLLVLATEAGSVFGVDVDQGRVVWHTQLEFPVRQPATLGLNTIVVIGVQGQLAALDFKRGTSNWTSEARRQITGGGVSLNRWIVTASVEGEILKTNVVDGHTEPITAVNDQIYATPCVRGASLALAGRSAVHVVDTKTGDAARYPVRPAIRVAAPFLGTRLLVTADLSDGRLTSTDVTTGTSEELAVLDQKTSTWLACIDSQILVACEQGRVAGLAPRP